MAEAELMLANCSQCGAYSFPANAWACRACGASADLLRPAPLPQAPRLLNAVTLHAELAPGLPVPCVIGEVELAPGLVEEALIGVADEASLAPGQALQAEPWADARGTPGWRFVPGDGVAR